VRAPPNEAVRRFASLWAVSTALKLVGLAVFLLLVAKLAGGF
jgi:hypothetical protein